LKKTTCRYLVGPLVLAFLAVFALADPTAAQGDDGEDPADCAPQYAPVPIGPSGATANPTPTFEWNAVDGATTYTLFVRDVLDDVVVFSGTSPNTSYTPELPLLPVNRQLSWDVLASNNCGSGPLSLPLYFVISASACAPTQAPSPGGPAGSTTDSTPLFSWSSVPNAACYTVDVRQQSNGGLVLHAESVAGTYFAPAEALPIDVPYRWTVRAKNACGPGPDSQRVPFVVASSGCPPTEWPVPVDGPSGIVYGSTPTFSWHPMVGATSYTLFVRDIDADNIAMKVTTKAATFTATQPLPAYHLLIWDVQANSDCGPGPLSYWITFMVSPSPCAPQRAPMPNGPVGSIDDATPTFSWSPVPGAASYTVFVVSDDGGVARWTNIQGLSFTPTERLPEGVPLRWRVWAENACGPGPESPRIPFVVHETQCPVF
jgi:hypothetical protein